MIKSFLSDVFLKYFLVAFGLVQLGVFSPQAHAVLPVPTRPTSFPLSPVSYTTPGTVVVWGSNFTIPSGLSNVVQVAAGDGHSLVLQSNGTVVAWGYGAYGQWDVPRGLSSVVQVAAGGDQSLALKSNGTVVAWGYGGNLPSGLSNVVQVASGGSQSLALKRDGTVVIWGDSSWNDFLPDQYLADPPYVPVGLSNVVQVAAGSYHRLALKSDGTVVGWGADFYGAGAIPVGLSNVVQVAAGGYHSLALKSDGTVVAWGLNSQAQATVPGGLSNVVQVAAGETHSLALKSDGTVVGWGYDGDGQATIPGGLSNVFQVAAGGSQSLALNIPLSQTIRSFATIPTKMYGTGTFTVTAPVATSGLPVTLSVVSGPATISANTVTLTGVGTVVLAANQAGNVGYSAATRVTTSFVINKGSQTIAKFAPISNPSKMQNGPAVTTPVATSGLPVKVTVRSGPGSMDEGRLYPLNKGIVVLVATQAGNANYTPAVPVTCKVVFNKNYN